MGWLLEWTGWLLPHGGGYRGRLDLREAGPATAEVVYPVLRKVDTPARAVPLTDGAAGRLRAALREAFPSGLIDEPCRCKDGFPFELSVRHVASDRGVQVRCNLGDGFDHVGLAEGDLDRPWSERVEQAVARGEKVPAVFRIGIVLLEVSLSTGEHP